MGSTSTPTPKSVSSGTVQNQVFGDQHVYGDQNFTVRPNDAQALVQDCLRSLAYPEMNDRSNSIRVSAGGTCEWLLQHEIWKKWKSSERGLLWIKGKPGSGKSTLLRYALHELKSTKTAKKALMLSFFFHGRGNDLQKNQLGLFRSLLHQVLSEMPKQLAKLVTTFDQRRHEIGRPGVDWTWELDELRESFKWSILDVLKNRPVWIFVDALDESGAENAKEVIRHFKDLLQGPSARSKLRICFACRHYPIESSEGGFEMCTEDENSRDILTYVRARLSDFQNPTALALPDLITERSSGLFIWARLVVDRILDLELADDPNSADQLINNIIDTLPRDLNALYSDIVRDTEKSPPSLKLMRWISCAQRPLSLDELRWAMVIDPNLPHKSLRDYKNTPNYIENDDVLERRVKTLSHGLVEIISSSKTRTVQFIHQSVKEFFDNRSPASMEEASGDKLFSLTEAAHYRLYRICIHYLTMEEMAELSSLEGMGYAQLYQLNQAALLAKYPLLSYVITSWIAHLERCRESHQARSQPISWPPKSILERWRNASWFLHTRMIGNDFPPAKATLVHVLARYGLVVLLQMLLGHGEPADINSRDDLDRTPLLYAAERGYEAAVQVLLEAGAEVDHQDVYGAAPLHFAALRGHVSIMRLLLVRGANADLKDKHGFTPLAWAIEGEQEAAVKMLLEKAVDVNGEYVLMGYIESGIAGMGFEISRARFYGVDDPWTYSFSHSRSVHVLNYRESLPLGATIEYYDDEPDLDDYLSSWNPLAKYLGHGHYYSKIGPRRKGARPGDRTPLLQAVELGLQSIVLMLLAKGANPELQCRTGWSPLLLTQLRRYSSDKAIMRLLEAHRHDSTT